MAREIDITKPLSDADRQYLIDRCAWHKLDQNAQYVQDGELTPPGEVGEAKDFTPPAQVPAPQPTVVGEQLLVKQANEQAGQSTPDPLADKPYEEWPFDELKKELDARKADAVAAGMDEAEATKRYGKGGGQKDLIARLNADDEQA